MSMQYAAGLRDENDPKRVKTYFGYMDEETGEFIEDKGRTKQEFADETNINNIVANIMRGGASDWLEKHEEWVQQVGTQIVPDMDYKDIMDTVTKAEGRFYELPSDIRRAFNNDPAEFLDFVKSEGGDVELHELLEKAKPPVKKAGSVMTAAKPTEEPATNVGAEPASSGEADRSG